MNYKYLFLTFIWMGFIFILSSIPSLGGEIKSLQGEVLNQLIRKPIHIVLYGTLTILMWKSIFAFSGNVWKKMALCGIAATLFAVSDEFHQAFVPGRCGNAKGVFFDVVGVGSVLIWLGIKVKRSEEAVGSKE